MSLYPPAKRPSASSQEADGRMKVIFGRNPQLVFPPTQRKGANVPTHLTHELRREHVYGFNGDTKASIHFLSRSLVVFPVAALVVIEDIHQGTQRHFAEHDSDVTCVALTSPSAPGERWCASGQMDPRGPCGPPIYVWSPATLAVRTTLTSHERAVCALAFSSDSQYLVSFGCDDKCTVMMWDLRHTPAKQTQPARQYSSGRQATRVIHPCGDGLFVSLGVGHWKYWVYTDDANGPLLDGRRGIFGRCNSVEPADVCTVETDIGPQLLLCGPNGFVYKASGSSCTSAVKATKDGVALAAICSTNERNQFIVGAANGDIIYGACDQAGPCTFHDRFPLGHVGEGKRLAATSTIKISQLAICGALCLIGTSNHALLVADIVDKMVFKVLHVGHAHESWALACHPTQSLAVSGSQGKDIRFWNVGARRATIGKVMRLAEPVHSVTFSPSGNYLVVGMDKGLLEMFSFPGLQPQVKKYLGTMGRRERICEVKYAPNAHFLAAASWDQTIYLLKVVKMSDARRGGDVLSISLFKNLTGNSSSPLKVLFSVDSAFIMSNSKDTQILYWRTSDGQRQTSAATFRDVQWDNWDCILGWPVIGIWGDPNYDGTDINAVAISGSHCAIGDDYYKVKLFPFPCSTNNPPCLVYKGHACPVTNLKFATSSVLLTLGGSDHCIMQWSLVPQVAKEVTVQAVQYPWAHFPMNDVDDPTAGLGCPRESRSKTEEAFGSRDQRHRNSQAQPALERGRDGRRQQRSSSALDDVQTPQPAAGKQEGRTTAQRRAAGKTRREDEARRGREPRSDSRDKKQNQKNKQEPCPQQLGDGDQWARGALGDKPARGEQGHDSRDKQPHRKHEQDPRRRDYVPADGDQWARKAWGDTPSHRTWHSGEWNNEWRNPSPTYDGEWREWGSPRYRGPDAQGDARWEAPSPHAHKSGAAAENQPTKGLFDGRWWEDSTTHIVQPRGDPIQKSHARESHAQDTAVASAKERRASPGRPTHKKNTASRSARTSKHREHVPAAVQQEQDEQCVRDYFAGERGRSPPWGRSKEQEWGDSNEQWRSGSPQCGWGGDPKRYGNKRQEQREPSRWGWSRDRDDDGGEGHERRGSPLMGDRSRDQDWRSLQDQGGIPRDERHDGGGTKHEWGDARADDERAQQKIRREGAIASKLPARSTEYHRNQSYGVANALRWD